MYLAKDLDLDGRNIFSLWTKLFFFFPGNPVFSPTTRNVRAHRKGDVAWHGFYALILETSTRCSRDHKKSRKSGECAFWRDSFRRAGYV